MCSFYYEDMHLTPPITQKLLGQFRMLHKGLGDKTIEVLQRVLPDWSGFKDTVSAQKGLKDVPIRPNVGFLLQNVDVALNYVGGLNVKAEDVQLTATEDDPYGLGQAKVLW